jgi:hypothetical protein
MRTLDEKLVDKLQKGICSFSFYKVNDEIRYAVGTQDLTLVPVEKHPKGSNLLVTEKMIVYYDFIKQSWRSLSKSNIIRIETTVVK